MDDVTDRNPSLVRHAPTFLRANQRHARPAQPISEHAHALAFGAQRRQGATQVLQLERLLRIAQEESVCAAVQVVVEAEGVL